MIIGIEILICELVKIAIDLSFASHSPQNYRCCARTNHCPRHDDRAFVVEDVIYPIKPKIPNYIQINEKYIEVSRI